MENTSKMISIYCLPLIEKSNCSSETVRNVKNFHTLWVSMNILNLFKIRVVP